MIPIRLILSGFLSYSDQVELDFTSFELACISGANGAGKSSLLDAITWALFGQARRRDDALINSHAKACEVTFDFHYEGNLYRVQRSKPRDKATVLEFYLCGPENTWRPLTEKTMRETEERIKTTLRMDFETFTNASFFLQGKADQFATQRPGDRKKVLASILGLEIWEKYRETAAEDRKEVERDINSVDGQLREIESELEQENERKEKLARIESRLTQTQELLAARETTLASMQRLALSINEQKRLVDVLARTLNETRLRYERMRSQSDALKAEQASFQEVMAREGEVTAAYQRLQTLHAEIERWDAVAANFREIEARRAGPLNAISAEEARLQQEKKGLYEQDLLILQEEARVEALKGQLQVSAVLLQGLEESLASRRELENELQEIRQQVADSRAENIALKKEMNGIKDRQNRLGEAEGAVCPVCGQPLSPEDREAMIADLQLEGKQMGDRFRANEKLLLEDEARAKDVQDRIGALTRVEDDLRQATRQHDRLEAELMRIELAIDVWRAEDSKSGAARLAELMRMLAEGDYAHEARARLAEIDAESKALGYDSAAHDAIRAAEVEARGAEEAMRALDTARASLAPLERQVGALHEQLAAEGATLAGQEEAYRQAQEKFDSEAAQLPDVDKAEREVLDLKSESNRLRMEFGMARQLVAVLDTQRERRASLQARREALSLRAARLKLLERAFSKDGVPALLIEQALPEIEDQANEILDRLSVGTMSVHFETQKQFKDKSRDDRRETLDILISDPAGMREYEMFSGGEAFRVNFAIRLALSRVLAQRAGARLQTLFIDEGFGSQDAEGRQRLIEVINQVRPEFAKILVITHLEELKEAFPARIEVEKGPNGSEVRVVA